MRLIDEDVLLEAVEKSRKDNPHQDRIIRSNHDTEHQQFRRLIERQPIVRDLDEIAGRLEERKNYLMKEFVLVEKSESVKNVALARINEIDWIIDIVKAVKISQLN